MSLISVIMLTYNRERLVSRAIDSVLAQTFSDFELIIVDNGSTDQSGLIADEYAVRDSRIRVFHRKRGNIGNGRNVGLEAATGEYIAFIDDDDWCESDYLEFLYSLCSDNGADIAICGTNIRWQDGQSSIYGIADKPLIMDAEAAIIELLWRKRFNNGFPTKLFKQKIFQSLRFADSGRYDDVHVMYKALANAGRIISFGLPKYNVTRHDGNNSAATTRHGMITSEYLAEYRTVYHDRANWLCEHFPRNDTYWRYFVWSFQISMVEKIVKYGLQDCGTHLTEMRRELAEHYNEFLQCEYTLDFEKRWITQLITPVSQTMRKVQEEKI